MGLSEVDDDEMMKGLGRRAAAGGGFVFDTSAAPGRPLLKVEQSRVPSSVGSSLYGISPYHF